MRADFIRQIVKPFAVREAGGQVGGSAGNFTMQGGIAGTPGTLPTGWTELNSTGLTVTHVYGIDRGQPFIDTRLNGTAVAGQSYNLYSPAYITGVAAAQQWDFTVCMAKIAGTFTNFSNCQIGGDMYNGAAYALTNTWSLTAAAFATDQPRRYATGSKTLTAGTYTQMKQFIQWYFTAAVATDITIRIQLMDAVRRA